MRIKGLSDAEASIATMLFWKEGRLRYLLRRYGQRRLYDFIHSRKNRQPKRLTVLPVQAHRRFGKTTAGILTGIERCILYPGQIVNFGAPTMKEAREIAIPNLYPILEDRPDFIDLEVRKVDKKWVFRNQYWPAGSRPSVFGLYGCDVDDGESLRGAASDMWILDEVRKVRNLRYIVQDILLHQFQRRFKPLLLLLTTPPRSLDHDFVTYYRRRGIEQGNYIEIPGSQNPDFTEQDRYLVLEEIEGSSMLDDSYQREVECKLIPSSDDLIIPEFQKVRQSAVVEEYPRPVEAIPLVCMDVGWVDHTAVLFGFVDFPNQTLVIEDEIFVKSKSSGEIAALIDKKEKELYGDREDLSRWADCPVHQINDFNLDHDIFFLEVEKHDRDLQIARLRGRFKRDQIRILSRCKNLIAQLECGIWNSSRKQFERTKNLGHCDALAALIYLARQAPWDYNTIPEPVISTVDSWRESSRKPMSSKHEIILSALGRRAL